MQANVLYGGMTPGTYRTEFLMVSAPYTVYSPVFATYNNWFAYVRESAGFSYFKSAAFFPDTVDLEVAKQYKWSTAITSVPAMCSAMLDRMFTPVARIIFNHNGTIQHTEMLITADLKSDGTVSATGDFNWAGNKLESPNLSKYTETVYTITPLTVGGTLTINCNNGNVQDYTFNANVVTTLQFSNAPTAGKLYSITLALHGAAGKLQGYHSSIKWGDGEVPTLSTGTDILNFFTYDGGVTWYGSSAVINAL
jgi:hypothetical protein